MKKVASEQSSCARITDKLVKHLGERRYNMWFDRTARLEYHDEPPRLEVAVPNKFIADWIGRHFEHVLRDAAREAGGAEAGLEVRVDPSRFDEKNARPAKPRSARTAGTATDAPRRPQGPILRHCLESFIVGSSNELAYAASVRLAESDDVSSTSPLFIHGGCGLGKTHLLQGICRRAGKHARVLYTTAEQFTNEFLAAMRANRMEAFRLKIRKLELLALDDVHFLANKQATQQEFLHSFDAIQLSGARLALASDNHPKLIRQFSEQLVSRCMRGMVVEVRPPDTQTRIRVIRSLASSRGLSLVNGVIDMLAQHCCGSVREIEGTLTKLHALANLAQENRAGDEGNDRRVGHALLNKLIHAEPQTPRRIVRFATIQDAVCHTMRVSPAQLAGSSRERVVVLARSLAVHLARRMTTMSCPEIAGQLGRRHHSTVVNAVQRVKKMLADSAQVTVPDRAEPVALAGLVEQLEESVRRA